MKRWLLCFALLALYTGCGTSNPVTPEPEPPDGKTYDHVTADEADAYIADIDRVFTSIEVFFVEYGGVTAEVTNDLVTVYWSRQFISNMIARIHAIQSTLHGIRPENPYLLKLHIEEFEAAFADYLDGATFLQQNLDFMTPEVLDGLNRRMGAGNVHIIRLQIFLRDLIGLPVTFGGDFPRDGQTF
ncbi:MAG: hypothetical protein F4Y79_18930 [Gemmatimonadetes bacterium]|nr:hypothetical protein [Gemmatimonadota bacterium]MYF17724.1 hypothetical protein [Gemmatimonadota bacterium]